MSHYVVLAPVGDGCSFFPDDLATVPLRGEQDLIDRLCGMPTFYRVISTSGHEARVCTVHGAHGRACPTCSQHLVRITSD